MSCCIYGLHTILELFCYFINAVVIFQVMLAGPPGALVPAEVLVDRKVLL